MVKQVKVYYEGWGERWLWGTLRSTTTLTGRPHILFEYSNEAKAHGFELSSYTLPLQGPQLRNDFPSHQLGLPGPVYDALPDGWGMLLMDRLFKRRGLLPERIGPLERLSYIGNNAMGAMTFEPVAPEGELSQHHIALEQLASEVQEVQKGQDGEFLQRLVQVGGSPQGARPKALLYRDPNTGGFTTAATQNFEGWLIKFPANNEHPEVCAIEMVYAECLRRCGIETSETLYFALPNGLAAFASKRFDQQNNLRIPMQSLASFTGADYRLPGSLDYITFLRATRACCNDIREVKQAYERAVFNVVFNNRDDHPKNFAYLMSATGQWKLAPAYDVTFCEGPGGYHQMDVAGEALTIHRAALVQLANEANLSPKEANKIISRIVAVAHQFSTIADDRLPRLIRHSTLSRIQRRIQQNIEALTA